VFDVDKEAAKSFNKEYPTCYSSGRTAAQRCAGKVYYYRAVNELAVQVGDKVVVNSPAHGWTVVRVVEVGELESLCHVGLKWIVDKVDVERYKKIQEREEERRRLKAVLDGKAIEARKRLDYSTLLADDPEAMEMVQRLKDLG
jgi:hypothetical protein